MKKVFFYAALAAVALTSCSKHDDDVVVNNENNNTEEKQAIQFVMGSPIEITTRGTGAVGDTIGAMNVWAGEKLNVYMFDKGTLKVTVDSTTHAPYFENLEITAPANGTASVMADYGETKYYPGSGQYDFFAYRADDAVAEGVVPELNEEESAYVLPITIDGTQDLLVAKAEMNEQDKEDYLNHSRETNDPNFNRIYSSYSARRGIQPRFQFKHLLSRFVFNVKADGETDQDGNYLAGRPTAEDEVPVETYRGVYIDSIHITNARTNATLYVASQTEEGKVVFDGEGSVVKLMSRNNSGEKTVPFQPFQPVVNQNITIGESLMLEPSEEPYHLIVYYSQYPEGKTSDETLKVKSFYEKDLDLRSGALYEAGKQYNVNFIVYSAQRIELELELAPWAEGEDIPVDSEDEENH